MLGLYSLVGQRQSPQHEARGEQGEDAAAGRALLAAQLNQVQLTGFDGASSQQHGQLRGRDLARTLLVLEHLYEVRSRGRSAADCGGHERQPEREPEGDERPGPVRRQRHGADEHAGENPEQRHIDGQQRERLGVETARVVRLQGELCLGDLTQLLNAALVGRQV
jgi:hypothetical protein